MNVIELAEPVGAQPAKFRFDHLSFDSARATYKKAYVPDDQLNLAPSLVRRTGLTGADNPSSPVVVMWWRGRSIPSCPVIACFASLWLLFPKGRPRPTGPLPGKMHVQYLEGCKLFQPGAWGLARDQRPQANSQTDVQIIGQEGDEEARLDPRLGRMKNRAQTQVIVEGGLHLRQLNVKLPQLFRGLGAQIAAQKISPLRRLELF